MSYALLCDRCGDYHQVPNGKPRLPMCDAPRQSTRRQTVFAHCVECGRQTRVLPHIAQPTCWPCRNPDEVGGAAPPQDWRTS